MFGMLEQMYAKRQEILKEQATQNKIFFQTSPVLTNTKALVLIQPEPAYC